MPVKNSIAIVVTTFLSIGLTGPQAVNAADIPPPVLKAPAALPATNWTGVYINGGTGYGLWTAESNTPVSLGGFDPAAPLVQRLGGKGWLGRVGIGPCQRNYQKEREHRHLLN